MKFIFFFSFGIISKYSLPLKKLFVDVDWLEYSVTHDPCWDRQLAVFFHAADFVDWWRHTLVIYYERLQIIYSLFYWFHISRFVNTSSVAKRESRIIFNSLPRQLWLYSISCLTGYRIEVCLNLSNVLVWCASWAHLICSVNGT